ncbi:hypothetical protein [Ekhidna sp.]
MKLFILKTDIKSKRQLNRLKPIFQQNEHIFRWSIDLDDIDKVLKVETNEDSKQNEMIQLVRDQGIYCEELPD